MDNKFFPILPYSRIIGQDQIKLALELNYIKPEIGGALISGQRGTGKSSAVRSFAMMLNNKLPVTLPINATEDRVVGGWQIEELLRSNLVPQKGILEDAHKGILFIDEVNLLDDHIVNIILDVSSTGVLVVQREGKSNELPVSFTLVGTMNPEEGWLRPQMLDRFGFMINVKPEKDEAVRAQVLKTVLDFDVALRLIEKNKPSEFIEKWKKEDEKKKVELSAAKQRYDKVVMPEDMERLCLKITSKLETIGHRAECTIAFAARAHAALKNRGEVIVDDIKKVTQISTQHRRSKISESTGELWSGSDDDDLNEIVTNV